MGRCLIFLAYNSGVPAQLVAKPDDFIVCADGGYSFAKALNLAPDIVIGDFDSMAAASVEHAEIVQVPSEKDETDLILCLQYALQAGYREIVFVGGTGGRYDHMLGNIQAMAYACEHIPSIVMMDGEHTFTMITGCTVKLRRTSENPYISIFSVTDQCTGVSILGTKYLLQDAVLSNSFPLGVSNQYASEEVEIRCGRGKLLIVQ